MKSSSFLLRAAALVTAAVPAIGFAASETFLNGQSIYGQPATVANASRVVDLAQASRLNIAYGETVVFRGDAGQQFAWTGAVSIWRRSHRQASPPRALSPRWGATRPIDAEHASGYPSDVRACPDGPKVLPP